MLEEKDKKIRLTNAPTSEHRVVFEGSQESPRLTNALVSEPRDVIKYLRTTDMVKPKKNEDIQ